MYLIINKTKDTKETVEGSYPGTYVEEMLENGDDLIVVSTYTNVIKIPFINKDSHSYFTKSGYEWAMKEYSYEI